MALHQLTEEQLYRAVRELSREDAARLLPRVHRMFVEAGADTAEQQAAMLAQVAHESGGLLIMVEEGAHAGEAYEGRKDLGNVQPGDGVRFKGRGWIQLTGRANYRAAGLALGRPLEAYPDMAELVEVAVEVAGWFWRTHRLAALPDTAAGFETMTRRINGGLNNIDDRRKRWAKARAALGLSAVV